MLKLNYCLQLHCVAIWSTLHSHINIYNISYIHIPSLITSFQFLIQITSWQFTVIITRDLYGYAHIALLKWLKSDFPPVMWHASDLFKAMWRYKPIKKRFVNFICGPESVSNLWTCNIYENDQIVINVDFCLDAWVSHTVRLIFFSVIGSVLTKKELQLTNSLLFYWAKYNACISC